MLSKSAVKPRSLTPWLQLLDDEDLAFVKRFVLCSGSLKELALIYGVSYPTLRLRLDRLVEKIKIADAFQNEDDYERLLRAMFADGKLDVQSFRKLLSVYQSSKEK